MTRKFFTTIDGKEPPPKPSLLHNYKPRSEDHTIGPHTEALLASIPRPGCSPEEEANEEAFFARFESKRPRSRIHDAVHEDADKIPWCNMPPTSFDGPANEHPTLPYTEKAIAAMNLPSRKDSSASKEQQDDDDDKPAPIDPTLFPGGSRDLSFIGAQAFFLGIALASGLLLSAYFISIESAWWRLSAFIACLSLFHFLEYYTQARYNAPSVQASSFLLFSNGKEYAMAHLASTIEIIISIIISSFFPSYQSFLVFHPYTSGAGLIMVIVCQTIRSIAMATAATNFNHIVATEKKETHKLVTTGIYAIFRHPSYFGFFWWAMGTQFLVGNKICVPFFFWLLWIFFDKRIKVEERNLVKFFGKQYEEYRQLTGTGIPYIP